MEPAKELMRTQSFKKKSVRITEESDDDEFQM